nr:uncharacterized protein LOC122272781 [Parasteatoda tepidariorum]
MARKSVIKFFHIAKFFSDEAKLIERGENAVEANHVSSLSYKADDGIIEAKIDASKKDKVYAVQIMFEKDGFIKDARCACPRGMARCHQMAAALIYAHHNVSITDQLCRWNFKKPSKKVNKICSVEELFPQKKFKATEEDKSAIKNEVYQALDSQIVGFRWLLSPEPVPRTVLWRKFYFLLNFYSQRIKRHFF